MSSNNKFSFFEMLKLFGASKLFFCKEAYLSLLIPAFLFYSIFYMTPESLKVVTMEVSKFLIASDIAMLAIVISGFAIVLSVSGSDFLYFLNRKNLNIRFFFPFYLSSVLWGWHAIFSIALFFFVSSNIESTFFNGVLIIILFIYISFFLYALLNSISLVRTILRLGFEKVRLDEKLNNIDPQLLNRTNGDT